MQADHSITQHTQLFEEAHALLTEEANLLQANRGRFPQEFVHQKRQLMGKLDACIGSLQYLNVNGLTKTEATSALIDAAQKKLMQVLVLDKQNERLLKDLTGMEAPPGATFRAGAPALPAASAASAAPEAPAPMPPAQPAEPATPAPVTDERQAAFKRLQQLYGREG